MEESAQVIPELSNGWGPPLLPNGMTIEGIGDRSVELVSKLVAQL